MSYFIDDDASQVRQLKDKIESLQALVLDTQFSVQQENVDFGQSTFPSANPSARPSGNGTGSSSAGKSIAARLDGDQTSNFAVGEHVEFALKDFDGGLTLSTGSGQANGKITLEANKTYELKAGVRVVFNNANGALIVGWYDVTNAAFLSSRTAEYHPSTHTSNASNQPVAIALVKPSTPIDVELRVLTSTSITTYEDGDTYAVITEQGGSGSGGASVDPLIQTYNSPTQETEPTTTDLDASIANVFLLPSISKDLTIDIINPPASGKYELLHAVFTQDATGGRTISFDAGITFTNGTPVITETALSITDVIIYTKDQGVTWTFTVSRGGFTGTFLNTDLSNLSASNSAPTDIHMNSFDVDQLDRLLLDQAAGTSLAAGDTGITSDASSNLNSNVPAVASHTFTAASVEIAKLEEITAGVYQLDMLAHKIKNSREHIFDNSTEAIITNTEAVIGYSPTTEAAMLYNVPTGKKHIKKINDVDIMTLSATNMTFVDGHQTIFNPDSVNAGINIGLVVGDPSSTGNGDFWYNSTTNKLRTKENGVNVDVIGSASPLTTKGDLFGFSTVDARIPVGTNGQVLTADSAEALGVKWAVGGLSNIVEDLTPQLGGDLDGENNSIVDLDQLQITGASGATVRGFLAGATGVFDITSNENASQIRLITRNVGGTVETRLTIEEDQIGFEVPVVFTTSDIPTASEISIGNNGSDLLLNAPTGNRIAMSINGTERLTLANTAWGGIPGDDFRLFCVTSGNKAPINLEPAAGDPTTTQNGDIWYNSTSHKYKGKENGTIVTFTTT